MDFLCVPCRRKNHYHHLPGQILLPVFSLSHLPTGRPDLLQMILSHPYLPESQSPQHCPEDRTPPCSCAPVPVFAVGYCSCLLYTSPSPRDRTRSRMPSSA